MKRNEVTEVARGLRSIADVIEADFVDGEIDDEAERQSAALVLRTQASAFDVLA